MRVRRRELHVWRIAAVQAVVPGETLKEALRKDHGDDGKKFVTLITEQRVHRCGGLCALRISGRG